MLGVLGRECQFLSGVTLVTPALLAAPTQNPGSVTCSFDRLIERRKMMPVG